MNALHHAFFISHIFVGTIALILFWVPVVTRKGGINHRKFGRYYGNIMYLVALSGAIMASMVIFDPIGIKGHMLKPDIEVSAFAAQMRLFYSFLLFLSLLTYVSVKQGFAVLEYKQNRLPLRTKEHVGPLVVLVIAGITIATLGAIHWYILHIIFGMLGVFIGAGMLRYIFASQVGDKQWLVEHFSAMIGSGIGAYTAFIAFGGRTLLSNLGTGQIIFWIAPGVIGSIAIILLARHYRHGY